MRTPTRNARARRAQARYGVWVEYTSLRYNSFVYSYNISRLLYYPTIVTFIYASVAYNILFKQVSNAEGSELYLLGKGYSSFAFSFGTGHKSIGNPVLRLLGIKSYELHKKLANGLDLSRRSAEDAEINFQKFGYFVRFRISRPGKFIASFLILLAYPYDFLAFRFRYVNKGRWDGNWRGV